VTDPLREGSGTARTSFVLAALTWDIALLAVGWIACIEALGPRRGIPIAIGMTVLIVVEAAFHLNTRTTLQGHRPARRRW
jgi:hypothetical protein